MNINVEQVIAKKKLESSAGNELKKGDFFKLSENGCVYVRDSYDRSSKKYECFKYDDINSFRYLKGSKEVITDFIF